MTITFKRGRWSLELLVGIEMTWVRASRMIGGPSSFLIFCLCFLTCLFWSQSHLTSKTIPVYNLVTDESLVWLKYDGGVRRSCERRSLVIGREPPSVGKYSQRLHLVRTTRSTEYLQADIPWQWASLVLFTRGHPSLACIGLHDLAYWDMLDLAHPWDAFFEAWCIHIQWLDNPGWQSQITTCIYTNCRSEKVNDDIDKFQHWEPPTTKQIQQNRRQDAPPISHDAALSTNSFALPVNILTIACLHRWESGEIAAHVSTQISEQSGTCRCQSHLAYWKDGAFYVGGSSQKSGSMERLS